MSLDEKVIEGNRAQAAVSCEGLINFKNKNPLMRSTAEGEVGADGAFSSMLTRCDGDPQKMQLEEPPPLEQPGELGTKRASEKIPAMPPMREESEEERMRNAVGRELEFHHHKKKKALGDAPAMQAADFEFGPGSILRTTKPGEEKNGKKRDFRRTAYMAPPQAVLMSSSCARRLQ